MTEKPGKNELEIFFDNDVMSLRFIVRSKELSPTNGALFAFQLCLDSVSSDYASRVSPQMLPYDFVPIAKEYEDYFRKMGNELSALYSENGEQAILAFESMRQFMEEDQNGSSILKHIRDNTKLAATTEEVRKKAVGNRNAIAEMQKMRQPGKFFEYFENLVIKRYLSQKVGEFTERKVTKNERNLAIDHFLRSVMGTIKIHREINAMAQLANKDKKSEELVGISKADAKKALNILFNAFPAFLQKQFPDIKEGDGDWQQAMQIAWQIWQNSTFGKEYADWRPALFK